MALLNDFVLIDSEQRAKESPATWAHTPAEQLDLIRVGYFVKVGVAHPKMTGERFWGEVKNLTDNGMEIAVQQDMVHTALHGLSDKDTLMVQRRHVFGICDKSGDFVWTTMMPERK